MKKLFFYLFAIMAMVACSDDSSPEGGGSNGGNNGGGQTTQASLTISPTNVDFSADGGTSKVTITSSAAWTAEFVNDRADDWCSIDSTSGSAGTSTLTITATANDTPDDRTASIVVKSGTLSKTINVSQKQKDALTVTSSKFEVDAEGGEVVVEVKANIDFEYAIDESAKDWISYEGTRAIQTSTLVFKVAKNDDTEKREGKITIKSGEFSEEVMVYQAGTGPSIVISQNEYTVSSDGETIAVEVSSNVDVAVEIPEDVDWIAENTTRATSTNTYYFDITKNEDYDQRSAEIRFTNKENNLSEEVKVTQTQKDAIVVANDTYTVNGAGGTIEIGVGHNVDFDVVISADWITLQTTRAYETETLVFAIAENPSEESREGTITFISDDGTLKQVVKVIQSNSAAEIIVTLTAPKYYNNFITQLTNSFGDSIAEITHMSGPTYSITLKKGYSEIPESAFWNGEYGEEIVWLKSITIGNGITSIGEDAFVYCYSLESVTIIGNGNTSIEKCAFSNCEALKSVIIGDGVSSIGDLAFYRCEALESATIGDGVISIGEYAFYRCEALESITIPDSVTSIGEGAFFGCAFESITIPDSVTSIGDYAFENCEALESITIPNSVTSIGKYAFESCYALKSVIIGDSVTSIGEGAFSDCIVLENITIPNSVTSIGKGAFFGCEALSTFYGKYASQDNRCLIKDGVLLAFAQAGITTYSIPNNVIKIGDYAFYSCNTLESITIPDSVTSIGDATFCHCDALASVTIGNCVTSIGGSAFYQCHALASITIPDSVTSIGDRAFLECDALASVTIPDGVTSIGEEAFKYCNALASITIPDGVTSIGRGVFFGCAFESITIPDSVTSIGEGAFENCNALASVTIPDSVVSIGDATFCHCDALASVTIGNGVTSIGDWAFTYCSALKSVTIGNSVTSIGDMAFSWCDALEKVYCKPIAPPSIWSSTFEEPTIYVPIGYGDTYKNAAIWSNYAENIEEYNFE